MATVTIEIDGPKNENLFFAPAQRRVRGRFEPGRVPDPTILSLKLPSIPGQTISYDDVVKEAWIGEPLVSDECKAVRENILKRKPCKFEPARQPLHADRATVLFWMRNAVQSGLARVVNGELPSKIDGKPRTNFIGPDPVGGADELAKMRAEIAELRALVRK